MKRSLVITIAVQLVILQLAASYSLIPGARAQTTTAIFLDPTSRTSERLGETFNVTINIQNLESSQKLIVAQFRVAYNDTLLEALNVTEGSFMQQFSNTAAPPYTFFISYIEDNLVYGPNVLVGIVLYPTPTPNGGLWTNYPQGNGTLATITFKTIYRPEEPSPPASCLLNLTDTLLVGDIPNTHNVTEIPHTTTSATYYAKPIAHPNINIQPSDYQATLLGEMFNVSVNIKNLDPDWKLIVAQFRIQYNATLLEATSATEGSFMQQFSNTAAPPYTFFISYIEDNLVYGPNVLVGIVLYPTPTPNGGLWTNYPQGNGTLATITFKTIYQPSQQQQPITSNLILNDTLLVEHLNETAGAVGTIPHTQTNGLYEIQPLAFTFEPAEPSAGQATTFKVPTPENLAPLNYSWNFGDGTTLKTTEPTAGHVYASPGNYDVTLTCAADNHTPSVATQEITVVPHVSLDVAMDVGSLHFKGETAQFNILTTSNGEPINATKIEASLYQNDNLVTDLSSSARQVAKGYYTIPYEVPADAQPGTYTLIVRAEWYNAEGTSLKSFQINPTLTTWNDQIAQITAIQNGVATISNGVTNLQLNLATINATLTGLIVNNGQVLASISTTMGTLSTKLDTINAKFGDINGNTVTVSSMLGNITTKLDTVQTTATTTLYAASVLSAIAVILALVILIFMRKK